MKPHRLLLALTGFAALGAASTWAQDVPSAAVAPVRIGIVLPEAQLGQGNAGQDAGESLRQLIMSYMAGPQLELIPLQARISTQITAEARQQNCSHVLYTSIKQKKAGKGMGMGGMLSMLGPATSMIPGLGAMGGAEGALIASAATQAISNVAMQSAQEDAMASFTQSQAGGVSARDEISLAYQFVALESGKPLLKETLKAKARENGEDLLRPLVQQVAEKTVSAALASQG